jgi:hypothetical protein
MKTDAPRPFFQSVLPLFFSFTAFIALFNFSTAPSHRQRSAVSVSSKTALAKFFREATSRLFFPRDAEPLQGARPL